MAAFLSAPTEGIAKMFEALTDETASPEQLAELKADMASWGVSCAGCAPDRRKGHSR